MTLTSLTLILGALMAAPEPKPAATVLFVCEHSTEYAASREAMRLQIERLLHELAAPGAR